MQHQAVMRYSTRIQFLHWVTAILVLIAFIYGPGGSEERVYAASSDIDRQLHESLGLAVLTLVALRLFWRAVDAPPAPPQVARWMNITAKVVRTMLYVLLVAVPFIAIGGAWLEGHPLTLLGGIRIPSQLAEWHATGIKVASVHTWLGNAILWIAGVHAFGAIYHHFILKDNVLRSMLPGRSVS